MSAQDPARSETLVAARNAVTLGTSLALTGVLALIVRLLIPRFLGPSAFGELRLAESFAEMLFVVITFGVDTQMRLEAAVDASKARSYLCGLAALRLVLSAAGMAGAIVLLQAIGSSERVIVLFVLIGASQTFLALNNTYAALEHAAGDVKWLARTNFAAKAVWAIVLVAVLFQAASGVAIATAALAVEALRFGWFTMRGLRWHRLQLRPDLRLAAAAIVASLPIFLNSVTHSFYARIGIGWLAASHGQFEVGLYGAASNVAAIALIGVPLVSWVLVPSAARAAAHSDRAVTQMVSGALRIALLAFVPLAIAMHLGAALYLEAFFGPAYLAAAPVLRIVGPMVGLTYVSTICAIALIQRGRTWTVAGVSLAGVVSTVAFSAVLIPWGARTLGPAGGAQGAAWAALATEAFVTVLLAFLSRASWFEARLVKTVAALAIGGVGAGLTLWVLPGGGLMPPVAAGLVFVAATLAAGGVDRNDLMFCRQIFSRPRRTAPPVLSLEVS